MLSSARIEGMSDVAERVTKDALDLDQEERAELAYTLLRSLDGKPVESEEEVMKAWYETAERRWAEVERGEAEIHSGEEVARRAGELLARCRRK